MKIKDLKDNPANPRRVKDGHHAMLTKSMLEFGDISGIVYNQTTDRLLGGHQRKVSFEDNFPIVITKTYDPPTKSGTVKEGYIDAAGDRFNYREVRWDENKEIAANIAANKGAGQFDYNMLQEHLLQLDASNYDLNLTMYDPSELEALLAGWDSNIEAIDKIEENLDGIEGKIVITCPQELKDEVLIYLKAKLLETSFEGVHIE
jgi:hypothetical protein